MEGIERIKILASEIKDKSLLKIVEYLISREDMNEKYLNEKKSLNEMVKYIKSEAQKQAKNGMAMIEDKVVYSWAIHYFDESDEDLELDKKAIKTVPKVKTIKDEKSKESKKSTNKEWRPEGQLTLFDFINN